jgi:hypothetical protein
LARQRVFPACGGSEAEAPSDEALAIAGAHTCLDHLEQSGYVVKEDSNGMGLTVSSPDGQSVRVEARTTVVEGQTYLVAIFTGHEVPALRDAVRECVSPYAL